MYACTPPLPMEMQLHNPLGQREILSRKWHIGAVVHETSISYLVKNLVSGVKIESFLP